MRVGLLECDHVLPKYRHVGGDYRDMFPALFSSWEFVFYDVVNGHFPQQVDECEVYLCTGSSYSVYEEIDWIFRLKIFIRELQQANQYYLGVCFGHQLLAESLGGTVQKSSVGWCVGNHTFEIIKQESWMQPFQSTLNLLMMCQDQVVEMPIGSTLLAKTEDCPVGMFRVGEKMFGVQAHPEFPVAYDRILMEDRVHRMGQQKVEVGISSLDKPLHPELLRKWMEKFVDNSTNYRMSV